MTSDFDEDEVSDAIAEIDDVDLDSLGVRDNGTGSFLIESDADDQDVDEIDDALADVGLERDGYVDAPEMTQQFFAPIDDEDGGAA